MADRVQYIMDRMASTFRLLEELKLFTGDEVKVLIKRRTDFEYLIKRRQLNPTDFYRYLEFELNLESLREIRSQKQWDELPKDKQDAIRRTKSAFMKHICYVFERALRRFPGNMDLWKDYISFLKEKKSSSILNTVFGRALSLYPKEENLWLQAAVHELETNNNTHAARVLLQRSLRVNKTSRALWSKYFELELWNGLRLVERQRRLGGDPDMSVLEGAPLVVFKHAVASIDDLAFACSLHACAVGAAGALAAKLEEIMCAKFNQHLDWWSYLAAARVRAVLNDTVGGSGSRKNRLRRAPADVLTEAELALVACSETLDAAAAAAAVTTTPCPKSEGSSASSSNLGPHVVQTMDELCVAAVSQALGRVGEHVGRMHPSSTISSKRLRAQEKLRVLKRARGSQHPEATEAAKEAEEEKGQGTNREQGADDEDDERDLAVAAGEEEAEAIRRLGAQVVKLVGRLDGLDGSKLSSASELGPKNAWSVQWRRVGDCLGPDALATLGPEAHTVLARHRAWLLLHALGLEPSGDLQPPSASEGTGTGEEGKKKEKRKAKGSVGPDQTEAPSKAGTLGLIPPSGMVQWVHWASSGLAQAVAAEEAQRVKALRRPPGQATAQAPALVSPSLVSVTLREGVQAWARVAAECLRVCARELGFQVGGGDTSMQEAQAQCAAACVAVLAGAEVAVLCPAGASVVSRALALLHIVSPESHHAEQALRAVITSPYLGLGVEREDSGLDRGGNEEASDEGEQKVPRTRGEWCALYVRFVAVRGARSVYSDQGESASVRVEGSGGDDDEEADKEQKQFRGHEHAGGARGCMEAVRWAEGALRVRGAGGAAAFYSEATALALSLLGVAQGRTARGGGGGQSTTDEIAFARDVAEQGLAACGDAGVGGSAIGEDVEAVVSHLWAVREEVERLSGNIKAANLIQWRRRGNL